MAGVSATCSFTAPYKLLAAMSAADFASLQPHLKPVPMALLKDMERPNQRIETVYFMETGIASVVAVQPDETTYRGRPHRPRGNERDGRSARWQSIAPHATYIQVAGEGQRITAKELRKAMSASQTLHSLLL